MESKICKLNHRIRADQSPDGWRRGRRPEPEELSSGELGRPRRLLSFAARIRKKLAQYLDKYPE